MACGFLPTSHERQGQRRGCCKFFKFTNWPTWGELTVGWGTPVKDLKDYEDVKRKYELRLLDILYSQPHSLMVILL